MVFSPSKYLADTIGIGQSVCKIWADDQGHGQGSLPSLIMFGVLIVLGAAQGKHNSDW